ncbi:baseplate J/gp47 family protein [Asticcacaulis sp. BYS171W]|uniref:Baseplate J/gp47 family protein n=1 Tax=Asticcacaulis aquaticus TaxID=2984212 RepID=A0ABT5HT77_9CAUL|nr:baseplate J/gp47 family protein [Asticcacaulis aquaticus]MDC7683275.1 baseplate J/gp47 family protein [Asticcacaulis aquaticus]
MSDAAASNAIDLSLLPAPAFAGTLSYDDIYAEMKAEAVLKIPEVDFNIESDPSVKLLRLFAWFRMIDRQQSNDDAKAVTVAYATGAALDHLAALFRVARLDGETDDAFRERIVLAPDGYSTAGPEAAYIYHARSASPLIKDATAISPEPGQVVVTVLATTTPGTVTEETRLLVEAAVNAKSVRPLTDQVTVQSAEIIPYAITAELTAYQGPDSTVVLETARAQVKAYKDAERRLGRNVTLNGITSALRAAGVHDVNLISPVAPIVVSGTQAAYCADDDVSVIIGGYAE